MLQTSNYNFMDPVAKLLGTWSAELNTYSALFRLILVIALTALASGASAQASGIPQDFGRLCWSHLHPAYA